MVAVESPEARELACVKDTTAVFAWRCPPALRPRVLTGHDGVDGTRLSSLTAVHVAGTSRRMLFDRN